ncbi:MAG: glycosyltransferase [Sphingobium sp.]
MFLYPYLFYPLSLMLMRAKPLDDNGTGALPSASLLFCAYNEERALPTKLRNLEAIKALHPEIHILAYSDMSSDRTLELLLSRPDLLTVVRSTERTGKATGMRRMVAQATTDICIFTDANVTLDPASISPLLGYFRNPSVGGVSGKLMYVNDDESVTANVGGLYWRLEESIKSLESHCGSTMGADGSIFATRRALYPEVPPHLLDDMTVSLSVLFNGLRLISAPDVIAYERNTTDSSEEFRRKRRIACRAFNTHRHLWPQIAAHLPAIDIYKYGAHKLLRWFGAPLLGMGIIALTAALISSDNYSWAAALWLAGATGLALGRVIKIRPFSTVTEILFSITATFIGITDSLRGRTYQTWAPAKSRD